MLQWCVLMFVTCYYTLICDIF